MTANVIVAIVVFSLVVHVVNSGSSTCGDLISIDGWRYDVTPLQDSGVMNVTHRSINGTSTTIQFTICASGEIIKCGSCAKAGVCQFPNTCYGQFMYKYMDPLLNGIGVQLRYYDGDPGQGDIKRATYITIACDPTTVLSDVQADGEEPLISIRMRSKSGCPAHGGYPPSFPFQYVYKQYTYTTDPKQGVVEVGFALDSDEGKKKPSEFSIITREEQNVNVYRNWGDSDRYHHLDCYYMNTTEPTEPFSLPKDSVFMGTANTTIYNPVTSNFSVIETDKWQYMIDGTCKSYMWFKSGTAIPVQRQTCDGTTVVYFDFKLGQPDGSIFYTPKSCYPFQTCGATWNTCKYPYCCNSTACVFC